jgi:ATP-dependent Clp protease protease subunit
MSKINTFEDFRTFALDKGVKPSVLDDQIKGVNNGIITPYILEERQLNVATYDIFSRMLLDRIVFLSGEVNATSMDTIVAQLLYLDSIDNRDINIYINSGGGDCYSCLELISVMDFVKSDVSTTVLGLAASMGAVLLCAGEQNKRTILPHSKTMIHQPLGGAEGQASDILIAAEEMKKTKEELLTIISNHTGQPYEKVLEDSDRDFWMNAQESVDYGIVDAIMTKRED